MVDMMEASYDLSENAMDLENYIKTYHQQDIDNAIVSAQKWMRMESISSLDGAPFKLYICMDLVHLINCHGIRIESTNAKLLTFPTL